MTNRQLFLSHVAQTSPAPIGLEILKAKGSSLWDVDGKEYIDLIAGFSVSNIGHGNQAVIDAITHQINQHMHLMVYGEIIQSPQVKYAKRLTEFLPENLDCVYFTNSGTEATEGAMKLAKRYTGRTQIIAFKNSYHGSTQGALSIMGDEYFRNAYRPLLPDILHLDFNDFACIDLITPKTACIIMETVQAEAGVVKPSSAWLLAIHKKCTETGTLLVLDEIQTGFGRTGTLWAFEQFGIVPDILLIGKALGGGMPLGAFISSQAIMNTLTFNPVLGHISTFAGHPVSCAAGLAAFEELVKMADGGWQMAENPLSIISTKEKLFHELLVHPKIKKIRSAGLLMAIEFDSFEINHAIIQNCLQNGIITDWFLFGSNCMRIAPPLIISEDEIKKACEIIIEACDKL
jgi:acetylornithine/N-succinyldiaminopimelate aminotransferase